MIYYDESGKIFLLNGKNYSYAMFVNKYGFLQHLHYGSKISESDAVWLAGRIGKAYQPDCEGNNTDLDIDNMPSECGFAYRGDFREPTVVTERADGASMSRYLYASHKISEGVFEPAGLPHARRGDKTLYVTLRDGFSDTEIVLYYTVSDDSDVLVRGSVIKNAGKTALKLKKAFSFCTELFSADWKLLKLEGNWVAERSPEITNLGHGVTKIQSLRGASSHQMNPFAALLRDGADEFSGECYGFQLIYSGSWAITAERNNINQLRIQGGVNDFGFCWKLGAGESFHTPQAALCYSSEGMGKLSREYADFIRERIMPPAHAFSTRPIVVNNWEATYFDFNNEKLFRIIDESAKLGIDTFVLDDGWFGVRDSDRSGLGDWVVNEKKLKGGLKAVIDRCKSKGMKFGLWFEPEMISPDSDLYRAHPDYAICKKGTTPVYGRNQLCLDLTRKEVRDCVVEAVSKVLRENEISYVKWDYNRDLADMYSESLPADGMGEFTHRYMLGAYDLFERITSAFPNILFEGCAGGGRRFDAGMLYYFPQIWTSDNTDAVERTRIQYGTSYCYPLSAMSCHVSVCPNHQTGRTVSFDTRGAVASLGSTGYELDISKLSEQEKQKVKEQVESYKKIADLVLGGDLYRLCDPFEGDWFCEMIVSKDKTRAYLAGTRTKYLPRRNSSHLRIYGLDERKTYRIAETGECVSGKVLAAAGIPFRELREYESFVYHIEEVKKK